MAKSTERSIVFRLKVENDPKMKAGFDAVVKRAKDAQQSINDSMRKGGPQADATKYWDNFAKGAQSAGEKAMRSSGVWSAKEEANVKKVGDAQAKMRAQTVKDAEKAQAAADKASEKYWARESRKLDKAIAENDRYWTGEARKMDKAIADKARASDKYWAGESRRIDKALAEAARAQARFAGAKAQFSEAFTRSAEGVMKLGRGFALLGLVGEENLQKFKDSLLKIQGAFDMARGGLDLYVGLSKGVNAYRQAIEAATVAQKALAAAQALGGGGGLGGMAKGLGGMRGLLPGAAGVMGKGGMGIGAAAAAAPAATLAALAAAVAGVGAAAMSAVDGLKQVKQFGIGGGAAVGSWTDKVATSEVKVVESIGAWARANEGLSTFVGWLGGPVGNALMKFAKGVDLGSEKTERMAAALAEKMAHNERQEKLGVEEIGGKKKAGDDKLSLETKKAEMEALKLGLGDKQSDQYVNQRKRNVLQEQLAENAKDLAGTYGENGENMTPEKRQAALDRERELMEKLLDLDIERAKTSKDMHHDALEKAKEAAKVAEDALEKQKSAEQDAKQRRQEDLEKFAGLDPFAQKGLKDIKDKLAAGKDLSQEEAGLADQFNQFRDKAKQNRANKGEADDVDGVFFEDKLKEDVAAAKTRAAEREVVKTKNDVDVNVSFDEKLGEQVVDQLQPLLDKMQQNLEESVKNAVAMESSKRQRENAAKTQTKGL